MPVVKQLSIFLANRPGALARISESLAEKGINIKAMTVSDTVDHAVVRLVLSEPDRGQEVLEDGNLLVVDNPVVEVPLDSRPGVLSHLAGKLSAAGLNIEYLYGSTAESGQGTLYLRVQDPEAAEKVIKNSTKKR